jgi:hypothetical protein
MTAITVARQEPFYQVQGPGQDGVRLALNRHARDRLHLGFARHSDQEFRAHLKRSAVAPVDEGQGLEILDDINGHLERLVDAGSHLRDFGFSHAIILSLRCHRNVLSGSAGASSAPALSRQSYSLPEHATNPSPDQPLVDDEYNASDGQDHPRNLRSPALLFFGYHK